MSGAVSYHGQRTAPWKSVRATHYVRQIGVFAVQRHGEGRQMAVETDSHFHRKNASVTMPLGSRSGSVSVVMSKVA